MTLSRELILGDLGTEIALYGPKADGTYIVEFWTAASEASAISVPRTEAGC
jgi:hypothetical protein